MKKLFLIAAVYIFGLFILSSCQQGQNDTNYIQDKSPNRNWTVANSQPPLPDTYCGIKILNSGPRGGGYTSKYTGENFGYRIFRTHVINDTIVPIELTINFPSDSVVLLPTSDRCVRVFLFPHSMTPAESEDIYNYGITGLESFLDRGLRKPTMLKITIKPKEDYVLYIGALLYHAFGGAGAELFIRNKFELVYSISIGMDSALIPCGQIVFKK